jgi:alpha-N-arabinofuranosidase
MSSYAPLFVNVNPGGRQWSINLIGFDALNSFGSPSYYLQTMFDSNIGDSIVSTNLVGNQLAESVTRDSKTGVLYVKLVNTADSVQPVHVVINGADSIQSTANSIIIHSDNLTDVNSLTEPTKVVPVNGILSGIGSDFNYSAPAYSASVIFIKTKN